MTLIVAIEPDRRQANCLGAMVRGKLKAELVLADSAEGALTALGGRVPDVILTSALLSPKDETAIAEWLRTLDSAAAHVQTLTIPVFAPSRPRPNRARSMFASLIGSDADDDTASVPDGCDPAVFAEQCADYLERARAERTSHEPIDIETDPEPRVIAMHATHAETAAPHAADVAQPFEYSAADRPPAEFLEFDLSQLLDTSGRPEPIETPPPPDDPPAEDGDTFAASPADDVWVAPRLEVERVWPSAELRDAPARPAASNPAPPARRVPRGHRPVQDEWGFFDPEHAGFVALLAKLQEITEGDDPPAKRPA